MGSQPDSTEIPIDSKWTSSHSSFNLILTTATIPASLNAYFLEHFPNLVRITSPNLHRLPRALQTERVDTAGGNPLASIHKKLVEVFAEGAREAVRSGRTASDSNSQVILFCNRTNKATELGAYLENMGLTCLVMTGSSDGRRRGSNKHLEGFLAPKPGTATNSIDPDAPRILITTSLLARGLDFAPTVSHVLIADEPRNEVDFLHRAGRTGRAGRSGTVVVFGKGVARGGPKKVGFA
jgi:ATP-dependent RNA helicase MRH4, mitochondrial